MKQPNFTAFGVFHEDTLIGFLTGYRLDHTTFFNSGLYCESKVKVKTLLEKSEQALKHMGYTSWETEELGHIRPLAHKFGARVKYTRYKKEI
jgi:hypothetical protein